jgi:hypothetical protein
MLTPLMLIGIMISIVVGVFSLLLCLGLCRAAKRADQCLEARDPRLLGNDPLQYPVRSLVERRDPHGKPAMRL